MPSAPLKKPDRFEYLEKRVREMEDALYITGLIFKNLSDGLVYINPSGKIARINMAMEGILGKKEVEVRGRPLMEIAGDGELCEILTTEHEKRTVVLGGSQYEVEGIELKGRSGERLGLVAVFRDVADRQKMERERLDFLSMITHDLKSPLTTILGYTDLIRDGSLGEVSSNLEEPLEAIERSGKKLLGLIDDVLTVSRYETGIQPPVFAQVQLEDVVRPVAESYAAEAARMGKKLGFREEPWLPSIPGDAKQLERLATNLLDNALKFTSTGGEIIVEAKRAALTAGGEAMQAVELIFRDNGVGISADEIPHLFDRYWRGRKSRSLKGSGLGLAIVKCVAEMHGGSVSVKSEEGKGSEFSVIIPAKK